MTQRFKVEGRDSFCDACRGQTGTTATVIGEDIFLACSACGASKGETLGKIKEGL